MKLGPIHLPVHLSESSETGLLEKPRLSFAVEDSISTELMAKLPVSDEFTPCASLNYSFAKRLHNAFFVTICSIYGIFRQSKCYCTKTLPNMEVR